MVAHQYDHEGRSTRAGGSYDSQTNNNTPQTLPKQTWYNLRSVEKSNTFGEISMMNAMGGEIELLGLPQIQSPAQQREAQRRAVETAFFTLAGHAAANPPIIIRPTRPARHQATTPQRVPASRQATTSQRGPANRLANRQTRMESSPPPENVLSHGVQSPVQGQNPFSPTRRRRRRRNVNTNVNQLASEDLLHGFSALIIIILAFNFALTNMGLGINVCLLVATAFKIINACWCIALNSDKKSKTEQSKSNTSMNEDLRSEHEDDHVIDKYVDQMDVDQMDVDEMDVDRPAQCHEVHHKIVIGYLFF
jgi:predicted outer membrane lipoprotein